jgi:predicted transcriptional regulator
LLMEMRIDGEKLKQHRLNRFLDVKELAERAGVNQWTVTKMEHGDWPGGSRPSTVRKLAEALDIDPHELLVEDDGQ